MDGFHTQACSCGSQLMGHRLRPQQQPKSVVLLTGELQTTEMAKLKLFSAPEDSGKSTAADSLVQGPHFFPPSCWAQNEELF